MFQRLSLQLLGLGAAGAASAGLLSLTAHARANGQTEAQDRQDRLVQVHVVFRHGARTPLEGRYWSKLVEQWDVCGSAYEGCPLLVVTEDGLPRPCNEDDLKQVAERYPGGCSKGELTLEGQKQARDLGQWLRWRYVMIHAGFLPAKFEPGTLGARTTNYSRTVATLRGVLAGLYPSLREPVTVVTTDDIDEILYANIKSCSRLSELIKNLNKAHKEAGPPLAPEVQHAQQMAREALGLGPTDRVNFVDLHDAITTARAHGKPLPKALQDTNLQKVVEQAASHRFLSVLAPHAESGKQVEVLRLSMGRLIQMIVRRMEKAASGKGSVRLHLYSGHDSTIMPLLVALGKEVNHWPPYCSNLVLELWERHSDGQHYVKVLYNRKPLDLGEMCPGDPSRCGLAAFKEHVLGPFLLTREAHREECMLSFHHDRPVGDPGSVEEHKLQVGSAMSTEE